MKVPGIAMAVALGCCMPGAGWAHGPATPVAETIDQIRKLPARETWWRLNGANMRWNNLNLAKFAPTVTVHRDGPVRPLAHAPNPAIGAFEVDARGHRQAFGAFLDSGRSTTMGVVIVHRGHIAYEHYPRQQPQDKPLLWSVTKAFVSTVVAILEDRGEVDVSRPIDSYVPALKDSPYGGVAIRNVLDMASGIDCPDEYEDKTSCYYRYSASIGEDFRGPDAPDNPYDFIAGLPAGKRFAEPGTSYSYSGLDTFVLGWLVEERTGLPFQEALSREVWRHLGAEADALIWAGRLGIPLTSGGLMARLRDVARFGLLFTPSWAVVADRRIISDRYLDTILHGGDPKLLANARTGNELGAGVRHSTYQWDRVWDNDDFMKGGWAGQGLLINPVRDLVAVWSGYFDDEGRDDDLSPIIRAVLEGVYGKQAEGSE